MRHLLDIVDLSEQELNALMDTADDIAAHPEKYCEACKGKKLATLFFEPSTRTRLSFEAAMLELGGSVLGFSQANSSSAAKGESVSDTLCTVGCYADIIAMRHPMEGAPMAGIFRSPVPVINAGDGGHNHPTQTLTDLLTIRREKGRLHDLHIGLCGDLKYGRTVHSLVRAMVRYPGVRFTFISPKELRMPDYIKHDVLDAAGISWTEVEGLEEAMEGLDMLYMTRIQRERFDDPAEYERLKDSYVLDVAKMEKAPAEMIVLHPLPRVNEISVKVDDDKRACYFRQVLCGKYMRMALILSLLSKLDEAEQRLDGTELINVKTCPNPKCITTCEQEIDQIVRRVPGEKEIYRCIYCEAEVQ